jgi:long-chain acyl-CoA synthetase
MLIEKFTGYIENSIKSNWNSVSLSDYKGEEFTYAGIAAEIIRLHEIFKEAGVNKEDKISLLGKNSARWCIAYLAIVS